MKIPGRDGDPDYVQESFVARQICKPWFSETMNGKPATLMEIVEGPGVGNLLIVQSRWTPDISEQIKMGGVVGIVVTNISVDDKGSIKYGESQPFNVFSYKYEH